MNPARASAPDLSPRELQGLECTGCKAYVPLTAMAGTDPTTGREVRSAHVGMPHDGCRAKGGTWRGHWQLSLFGDGHG
jgi:hypothetical protein